MYVYFSHSQLCNKFYERNEIQLFPNRICSFLFFNSSLFPIFICFSWKSLSFCEFLYWNSTGVFFFNNYLDNLFDLYDIIFNVFARWFYRIVLNYQLFIILKFYNRILSKMMKWKRKFNDLAYRTCIFKHISLNDSLIKLIFPSFFALYEGIQLEFSHHLRSCSSIERKINHESNVVWKLLKDDW